MARLGWALVMLACTCLAGSPAHALDPTRSLAQFRHTAWTLHDGIPAYVNALAQTPDGYLWIGAASGLYRFDGLHVERFEQGLPGDGVILLAVTPSGDLWIGTPRRVSRLGRGQLTTFSVPDLGPSGFRHISLGPHGEVWIAGDKVARFDGRGWQVMQSDWGSSLGYRAPGGVWGLAVDRDGVVWSKNLTGLYFLRPGSTRFVKAEGYGGGIGDFGRAPDGRLWTADTTSGRFYVLPRLGPSGPAPPAAQLGAPVPPKVLGHLVFDRDGALWCANPITGGLYRMRSVTGSHTEAETFTPAQGLTDAFPGQAYEDREGDIWVGTATGLNRFAPANVVTEPAPAIRGGSAQIAASKDAVYIYDAPQRAAAGDRIRKIYAIAGGTPRPLALDATDLTVLNAAGADAVLVGRPRALLRLHDGVATTIPLPEAAGGASLVSANQAGDDLWAVFGDQGLFHRRAGVWTRAPGVATTTSSRVRVDRQGAAWLFDDEQIRRLVGDRLEVYSGPRGPDIGAVDAFVAEPSGVLLASDHGVSWFDGRAFHTLSRRQAPFLDSVAGVVADDAGGTWFHVSGGIYRVATRQLDRAFRDPAVTLDGQLFDSRDGLLSTATFAQFGGSAVRGPDGRLWFVNTENLAWIDPHHLNRNTVPPPVRIRSLTVGGRALDPAKVSRLAAGVSNLQVDYTAISLQNPDRVKFRYRLEGVDRGWVNAGDRRQAFYTRLAPGHYRFRVIAANNDGVWNTDGATLAFEIPPTFVQSGWFALLVAAAAALALWLAYSLRMRQVTAAIQSRHEARVAERERIARELHDTLLQGFQGLVLRFQAIMEDLPAGPQRREMDAALDRADEVLVSGRDRVRDLRMISTAGDLEEALAAAGEIGPEHDAARFELSIDGQPRTLRPVVAEELAAIGREAILNARRHARAQHIKASLIYGRPGLTLGVIDDGVGLDTEVLAAESRAGHFGLQGMRERADKIEARLTLSSRSGGGLKVEIFVPGRMAFAPAHRQIGFLSRLREAIGRSPDKGM